MRKIYPPSQKTTIARSGMNAKIFSASEGLHNPTKQQGYKIPIVRSRVVYTKTGDLGTTSGGAGRIGKDSQLAETLGAIDELNSRIGWCRYEIRNNSLNTIEAELTRMQDNLMTIASGLAGSKLRISGGETGHLEKLIDRLEKELPGLTGFIYPYGPLHLARTAARTAERETVRLVRSPAGLQMSEPDKQEILKYLNRISDALFMLARKVNFGYNLPERVWKKRK